MLGAHGPAGARVGTLVLMSVLAVAINWMNRRAVRHHVQPMRDDLAWLVRDVTAQ